MVFLVEALTTLLRGLNLVPQVRYITLAITSCLYEKDKEFFYDES